jgi:hypothetical protein
MKNATAAARRSSGCWKFLVRSLLSCAPVLCANVVVVHAQAPLPRAQQQFAEMTVAAYHALPTEQRLDSLNSMLTIFMTNLGSSVDAQGRRKPADVLQAHRRMYRVLDAHFYTFARDTSAAMGSPHRRLLLTFMRADSSATVGRVFMDHIRQILRSAEQQ